MQKGVCDSDIASQRLRRTSERCFFFRQVPGATALGKRWTMWPLRVTDIADFDLAQGYGGNPTVLIPIACFSATSLRPRALFLCF